MVSARCKENNMLGLLMARWHLACGLMHRIIPLLKGHSYFLPKPAPCWNCPERDAEEEIKAVVNWPGGQGTGPCTTGMHSPSPSLQIQSLPRLAGCSQSPGGEMHPASKGGFLSYPAFSPCCFSPWFPDLPRPQAIVSTCSGLTPCQLIFAKLWADKEFSFSQKSCFFF